jgi:hypothetical protein
MGCPLIQVLTYSASASHDGPHDGSHDGSHNGSHDGMSLHPEEEQRRPARLAYDRPSHKFISFLATKFNLRTYTPQNNNYVVFRDYWEGPRRGLSAKRVTAGEQSRQTAAAADSRWTSVSQRQGCGWIHCTTE